MYYYVLLTILPINLMPLIHVVKVNDLRSLWVWDKPGDDFLESFWLLWDSEIPAEKCNVTGKVQHLEERNISEPPPLCTADPRPALPGPKLGRKAGTWDWARLEIEPPVTWPNRSEASKPLHVDGQSFFDLVHTVRLAHPSHCHESWRLIDLAAAHEVFNLSPRYRDGEKVTRWILRKSWIRFAHSKKIYIYTYILLRENTVGIESKCCSFCSNAEAPFNTACHCLQGTVCSLTLMSSKHNVWRPAFLFFMILS